jgi:hypothetical protein
MWNTVDRFWIDQRIRFGFQRSTLMPDFKAFLIEFEGALEIKQFTMNQPIQFGIPGCQN